MSKLDKNILMKAFETKRCSVIFESRKRNFSGSRKNFFRHHCIRRDRLELKIEAQRERVDQTEKEVFLLTLASHLCYFYSVQKQHLLRVGAVVEGK